VAEGEEGGGGVMVRNCPRRCDLLSCRSCLVNEAKEQRKAIYILLKALRLACEEVLELMYFRPPTDEQRRKMYDHFLGRAKEGER
jgi:hypothetical protein